MPKMNDCLLSWSRIFFYSNIYSELCNKIKIHVCMDFAFKLSGLYDTPQNGGGSGDGGGRVGVWWVGE